MAEGMPMKRAKALADVRVAYEKADDSYDGENAVLDQLMDDLREALNPVTGPDGEAL